MPNYNNFLMLAPQDTRIPSSTHMEEGFGSVLGALSAAGVVDTIKGTFGTRCVAKDGHICNSLAELLIDDAMTDAGIKHIKEASYPSSSDTKTRMRADWLVGKSFVEYFGLAGQPDYDNKIEKKRATAQLFGLNLIELYPTDLNNLPCLIATIIHKSGISMKSK